MTADVRDGPYTVDRGFKRTDRWLLTNMEWHPNNWFGDFAQYETGVRAVVDGEVVRGSFELIQHGWPDFEAANDVILRGLEKEWSPYKIADIMERIGPKYPPPKKEPAQ